MKNLARSICKPLHFILPVLLMYAALQIVYLDFLPFLWTSGIFAGGDTLSAIQSENTQLVDIVSAVLPYDGMSNIVFGGLVLLVWVTPKNKLALWEKAFSLICAGMWLIGYSFHLTDDWSMLTNSPLSILASLLVCIGGGLFLQYVLRWAKLAANKLRTCTIPEAWTKHRFLKAWIFIFLCWLPFLLLRYPAGIEYDAYQQLLQAAGVRPLTAHNPLFSTLLISVFMKFGNLFASYELGLFLFVLFQALVCSGILAYTVAVMNRLHVQPVWQVASVLIYGLAAIYPNYLTALVKDAMFSAFVVLFVTLLAEHILAPESRKPTHHLLLGAAALLMCLLRTNGIIWLVCCTMLLAVSLPVYHKKMHVIVVAVLAAACILYSGYDSLIASTGIASSHAGEPLSLPFQQTARYVRDYPDDVTPEEADILRTVLDYDHLATLYDPNLSDPVKGSFTGNEDALGAYFKVWLKQLMRHPMVYLEATLNNSCGYYYPFVHNFVSYSNPESAEGFYFDESLVITYPSALNIPRTLLRAYVYIFESAPIFMILGSAGFQTWVILYLICAVAAKKDWKKLYVVAPALIGILVCIACPTFIWNGIRYALPYIYLVPLLMGICGFSYIKKGE